MVVEKNMLEIGGLWASYDQSTILRDVSINVAPGKLTCLMGRNGVGKSTTLKVIMGLVNADKGQLIFDGEDITRKQTSDRARAGIAYVPQGRDIFSSLTVGENLLTATIVHGQAARDRMDEVFELFPVLKEMLNRKGGVLSGGQQQQLAIGRALLTGPKLLILDEPTEGIQPSIIDLIEDTLKLLRQRGGMSILLVEQSLDFARAVADDFYIMDRGSIMANASIDQLDEGIVRQYLTV